MTHTLLSCDTHGRVMAHISMSHGTHDQVMTHTLLSRDIHERVMAHINEPGHTLLSHDTHITEL